ncbi:hypothetical protein FNH04_01770 [Streptomyces phyllanthi]|uniref:Uncharacterized protein n=1 Tax=Streptomyces phyllanthi TaxID=1803180 RepID=A0A5N8VU03_9ACTN|nr:hypothetical protein [Streptomyces phyllanthi]
MKERTTTHDVVIGLMSDQARSRSNQARSRSKEIFEGPKAYRNAGGSISLFRPEANARRFARSTGLNSRGTVSCRPQHRRSGTGTGNRGCLVGQPWPRAQVRLRGRTTRVGYRAAAALCRFLAARARPSVWE